MEFCKTCGEALNEEGLCPACYERMVKIMEQERTDDQTSPTQPKPLDISEEETLPVQPPAPIEHKAQNSLGGERKKQNALGGEHKAQNSLGDKPKLSKSKKTFFLSLGAVLVVLICAFCIGLLFPKKQPIPTEQSEPLPEFIAEEYSTIGTCGADVRWGFKEDSGELTIIGTGAMDDYKRSSSEGTIMPWKQLDVRSVKIYGISHIGSYAFSDCSLSSAELPNTVRTIGEYAFSGTLLTELTLPDSLEILGAYAFNSNRELSSVTIPSKLKTFGESAFCRCSSLSEIKVASGNDHFKVVDNVLFTKDGKTLLQYPAKMRQNSYSVPDGVETIGAGAFAGSNILTQVIVPESVKTISISGFQNCEKLTSIALPGVENIGEYAFDGCSALQSVTFGDKLKKISLCGFYGCTSLQDVTLPESLVTIEKSAFFMCQSLTSLTIPAATNDIYGGAFGFCTNLQQFHVAEGNTGVKSVDGVLFTKDGTVLIAYPCGKTGTVYTVPNGVENITYSAFSHTSHVSKVTLPASVCIIRSTAFSLGSVEELYYEGTAAQWDNILKEDGSGVEYLDVYVRNG